MSRSYRNKQPKTRFFLLLYTRELDALLGLMPYLCPSHVKSSMCVIQCNCATGTVSLLRERKEKLYQRAVPELCARRTAGSCCTKEEPNILEKWQFQLLVDRRKRPHKIADNCSGPHYFGATMRGQRRFDCRRYSTSVAECVVLQ